MIDLGNVHEALYAALKQDDAVAGGRVYNHVPQNVTFPYLEISDALDVEDDTTGPSYGLEHVVTLRAYTRNRGLAELFVIAGQVRAVLHQQNLEVDGLDSCNCIVEGASYVNDPDGITRQAIIRVDMRPRT